MCQQEGKEGSKERHTTFALAEHGQLALGVHVLEPIKEEHKCIEDFCYVWAECSAQLEQGGCD
jgi:hypothetical protein